jgi:hypothetical protein
MSADGDRLCALFRQGGITHATPFSIEACYGGVALGNRYTLEEVKKHDMLSAMVVAHPHHPASSARWIAEARSNPKIVGVKLHPAMATDVLSPDVFRLMDDAVGPVAGDQPHRERLGQRRSAAPGPGGAFCVFIKRISASVLGPYTAVNAGATSLLKRHLDMERCRLLHRSWGRCLKWLGRTAFYSGPTRRFTCPRRFPGAQLFNRKSMK